MPTVLETLEIQVLRLPAADRSRLLDRLIGVKRGQRTLKVVDATLFLCIIA